jgi:hypothetical protein
MAPEDLARSPRRGSKLAWLGPVGSPPNLSRYLARKEGSGWDFYVRRGDKTSLQHPVVFLLEQLQIRGEQAHDLTFGDRQTDAV